MPYVWLIKWLTVDNSIFVTLSEVEMSYYLILNGFDSAQTDKNVVTLK